MLKLSRTDAMIRRLRASKDRAEKADAELGRADGRRWATEFALTPELVALDDISDADLHQIICNAPQGDADGPGARLFFCLDPDNDDPDRDAATDFWSRACTGNAARLADSFDYLFGFVEGALAAWHEVKGQL